MSFILKSICYERWSFLNCLFVVALSLPITFAARQYCDQDTTATVYFNDINTFKQVIYTAVMNDYPYYYRKNMSCRWNILIDPKHTFKSDDKVQLLIKIDTREFDDAGDKATIQFRDLYLERPMIDNLKIKFFRFFNFSNSEKITATFKSNAIGDSKKYGLRWSNYMVVNSDFLPMQSALFEEKEFFNFKLYNKTYILTAPRDAKMTFAEALKGRDYAKSVLPLKNCKDVIELSSKLKTFVNENPNNEFAKALLEDKIGFWLGLRTKCTGSNQCVSSDTISIWQHNSCNCINSTENLIDACAVLTYDGPQWVKCRTGLAYPLYSFGDETSFTPVDMDALYATQSSETCPSATSSAAIIIIVVVLFLVAVIGAVLGLGGYKLYRNRTESSKGAVPVSGEDPKKSNKKY